MLIKQYIKLSKRFDMVPDHYNDEHETINVVIYNTLKLRKISLKEWK